LPATGWSSSCARSAPPGSPGGRSSNRDGRDRVRVEYGIETYFANEERAHEIESAIAGGQLYVVVDLDEDGSARIEKLDGS
jgi:uncharacterized membrane-anchored protein